MARTSWYAVAKESEIEEVKNLLSVYDKCEDTEEKENKVKYN